MSNRGRYIAVGTTGLIGGIGLAIAGASYLERRGYISIQGEGNPSGNGPIPTETPIREAFASTPTLVIPTETSTPTSTEIPTSTPTPTATSELIGEPTSDYPAFLNVLGNELSGVNLVTVDGFKDYWLKRAIKAESGYMIIQRLDRMFGQLSLPVKDILDRDLNFDWRNNQQGLGFDFRDLDVLRTLEAMKQTQEASGSGEFSAISRKGEDGYSRAATIVDARDFEKVVLAYVDEHLRINGIQNPAINPLIQDDRRSIFERIVYGDLGVQEQDRDDLWETVNDKFKVCETYTSEDRVRTGQPENTRRVEFNPDQEVSNNGLEEETPERHDSDNKVLVIMVETPDGFLRVEVYDLSNPPDPLNPDLDPALAETDPVRAYGGRWLPCGVGISDKFPSQISTPPPSFPSPVPTNEHRDEPNPEDSDIPDRKPPTEIP
jgi:hypothetical protein